ncbi:MAG: FtsQ-type POTRA domain-containing protein [Candidatus Jidaibacter sp.]|jgi:cell division protein FtsQ|nr:FtsQ-type POTRA domain-containing protein [Candidatus Jidaibacter sp.]
MNSRNTHLYKKYRKKVKRKLPPVLVQLCKNMIALTVLFIIAVIIFPTHLVSSITDVYKQQLERFDFRVAAIKVLGNDRVSEEKIISLSGIKTNEQILHLDLAEAKNKIEQELWIESVIVERVLPETIIISVKEESPQALYIEGAKRYLINRNGKKLQEVFKDLDAQDYVRVTGKGANLNFEVVMQELYNFTNIHKQIESLHYIDGRRWDVKLKNNIIIKLPETNIYEAAALFEENFGKISKLYKTCVVDLRLIPDKIYLKVIN